MIRASPGYVPELAFVVEEAPLFPPPPGHA